MSDIWEDYYSVLQVNYNAEPEVITGAYRLLSKKYHPDINKSRKAEETMKRINAAYSVLGDVVKRAQYNTEWVRKSRANAVYRQPNNIKATNTASDPQILKAREKIIRYYRHIKDNNYDSAYECISIYDKGRIKKADFIKWRETVGKTFELRSCELEYYKTHINMRAEKKIFDKSYEFTVTIGERDTEKNNFTSYKATKIAVDEGGVFGVYLGYSNIKAFIAEYDRDDKSVVDKQAMLEQWHTERSRRDQLTGMLNYKGFLRAAKLEVSRYTRYNSFFSIVVFEVQKKVSDTPGMGVGYPPGGIHDNTLSDDTVAITGRFISNTLRDVDIACRWKEGKFIVLLAETNTEGANKAVNRICGEFNKLFFSKNKPGDYHAMYAGISGYDTVSLVSTIKKCVINLAFAKLGSRRAVAGVFTRLRMLKFAGHTVGSQYSR